MTADNTVTRGTGALVVHVSAADRAVEEARARLASARIRTRNTLVVLRTEVSEKTDWHTWYRARPVVFITAAFAFGFLLARRR